MIGYMRMIRGLTFEVGIHYKCHQTIDFIYRHKGETLQHGK